MRRPVYYSGRPVTHLVIDEDLYDIFEWLPVHLRISPSLRRLCDNRPDVIAATLVEDQSTRERATPYAQWGTVFPCSSIPMCPELCALLRATYPNRPLYSEIRTLTAGLGRLVYVDGNKSNLKRTNLREVSRV